MKKLKYMAVTLLASLATLPLSAQARDASSYMGAWKSNLRVINDDVIEVVLYTTCILAAIFTIFAFIEHNSNNPNGEKTWLKLAGGLLMVFLITQVIKMVMP